METEKLKEKGLTDEQVNFVMAENGRDLKKLQRENETLTTDRDSWKERAETAETTLKSFDGIDPENLKQEIEDWKQKAENAEKDYQAKLAARDFEDALKEEISTYKFTSESAKKAVMADIRAAGLKVKDGKILGLSDLLTQLKEADASAFVDEQQQELENNRARFTRPLGKGTPPKPGGMSKEEIMKIKDPVQRQTMIAQNLELFG